MIADCCGKKACMLIGRWGGQLRLQSGGPRGPSGGRGQTETHRNSTSEVDREYQRLEWVNTRPVSLTADSTQHS